MKLQVMIISTSLTLPTWHKTTLKLGKNTLGLFQVDIKKY